MLGLKLNHVSKLVKGATVRGQAITRTSANIWPIDALTLRTRFRQIWIKMHDTFFKENGLKLSSAKISAILFIYHRVKCHLIKSNSSRFHLIFAKLTSLIILIGSHEIWDTDRLKCCFQDEIFEILIKNCILLQNLHWNIYPVIRS